MNHAVKFVLATLVLVTMSPAWSACPGDVRVQLQVIGSGGPGASSARASASYVVWVDGVSRVLVDTGSGTKDQFHAAGASLNDIGLVGISHLHPDHSVELPGIMWPRGGNFALAGPTGNETYPSIEAFIDGLFGEKGLFRVLDERIDLEVITVDVDSNEPANVWQDGDIMVRGMGVPHGTVPTVGFRVDIGDASIGFASDQNGSDPAFSDFVKGVDILVVHFGGNEDSGGLIAELHAKPSVWGEMATDAEIGELLVSHISDTTPEVLEANIAYLQSTYDGPMILAEDLMCVPVD